MESRIEHCDLTEKNNTFERCPATITVKVIIALFANPTVHTGINRVAFSGTPDAHPVDPVGLAILVRLDSLALIKERKFVKIMESTIEHCDLTKKIVPAGQCWHRWGQGLSCSPQSHLMNLDLHQWKDPKSKALDELVLYPLLIGPFWHRLWPPLTLFDFFPPKQNAMRYRPIWN